MFTSGRAGNAADLAIQFAARGQHGVAQLFGGQAAGQEGGV